MRDYVASLSSPDGRYIERNGKRIVLVDDAQLPLPNVWLGTSVEDQRTANQRIPELLETPAAVRWISAEPLLGPVWLSPLRVTDYRHGIDRPASVYALRRKGGYQVPDSFLLQDQEAIDWIVCGGESGPRYRPMERDWAHSLMHQCKSANVPFFMKQMAGKKQIPPDLLVREYPTEKETT